jgi:hypothetical protein
LRLAGIDAEFVIGLIRDLRDSVLTAVEADDRVDEERRRRRSKEVV